MRGGKLQHGLGEAALQPVVCVVCRPYPAVSIAPQLLKLSVVGRRHRIPLKASRRQREAAQRLQLLPLLKGYGYSIHVPPQALQLLLQQLLLLLLLLLLLQLLPVQREHLQGGGRGVGARLWVVPGEPRHLVGQPRKGLLHHGQGRRAATQQVGGLRAPHQLLQRLVGQAKLLGQAHIC